MVERLEQLGKDLEAHHSLYIEGGVYDKPVWKKETDTVLHRFPRASNITDAAPLLLQLKEWQEKGWVTEVQFKGVTETELHEECDHVQMGRGWLVRGRDS
jgi:hypothetical protein